MRWNSSRLYIILCRYVPISIGPIEEEYPRMGMHWVFNLGKNWLYCFFLSILK